MSVRLKSDTVAIGDALVCALAGDVTMDSEPIAAHALNAALDRAPSVLAVDLSRVELFTSTGLNLLLTLRQRTLGRPTALVLVAPSDMVRRVLEITETAPLFPVRATAEQAVRHSLRPPAAPR
ncbi:anti-sigma factor antagonist [Kitasatospora xanthocidica]|uniref:STAS domain-containing protein n=1 Tax=Kitasatospora xanthocidica TaxID=83382 RepID=UPI00167347B8|nr:STAS domain-containing protein [Kitasatospora xanthocidica]GHF38296.1 anti-sigma factor antagonist [Kitasatospora xanthocidica]